jgi:hypothetical protein
MDTTITVTLDITTLINILTVEPENQTTLLELLRYNTDSVVSTLDGWISTSFIVAKDGRRVVIYSQWRNLASVERCKGMRKCGPTSRGSLRLPRSTASPVTLATPVTP